MKPVSSLMIDDALARQISSGEPSPIEIMAQQRLEIARLRAALFKIQCDQLRIASATDMTRGAMREAAMETRNEIIAVLGNQQGQDTKP